MANQHYRFNPITLSYDVISIPFKRKVLRVVAYLVAGFVMATISSFTFTYFFDTPKTLALKRERADLLVKYELLEKRLGDATEVLTDIQQRDNNIYRSIFEADTIPTSIREAGFGGNERFEVLSEIKNGAIAIKATMTLDKITRQAYIQSKSFDDVIKLAKQKEQLAENMPAIQPVSLRDHMRLTDFFGFRRDPFNRSIKFHEGIDISAPLGTDVYSAGNGVVEVADISNHGYGNQVVVNHGFGYKTRYAHLKAIKVIVGQRIKRGEIVGYLGNTGRSTGPHLHYEVVYRNKPVNPINYFGDLDQADFDKIIDRAALLSGVSQD